MVGLLTATGVASAAAVGLLAGIVWAATGAGALSTGAASVLAVGAVLLDVAARRLGRPRPLAVHRQVPQLWGRLFGPGVVAVLYGSRLGVGPLTILTTWTWWAALLVGASLGPWPSAAVGAAFAISRTVTMLVAVAGTRTGPAMATRVARVRRAQPLVSWVTALVLVLVVAACSGDDGGGQVSGGTEGADDPTELVLEPSTTAAPAPTTAAPTTTAPTPGATVPAAAGPRHPPAGRGPAGLHPGRRRAGRRAARPRGGRRPRVGHRGRAGPAGDEGLPGGPLPGLGLDHRGRRLRGRLPLRRRHAGGRATWPTAARP